jgi:hypothetical protein
MCIHECLLQAKATRWGSHGSCLRPNGRHELQPTRVKERTITDPRHGVAGALVSTRFEADHPTNHPLPPAESVTELGRFPIAAPTSTD